MDRPYASQIAAELKGVKNSLDDIAKILKLILDTMNKEKKSNKSK
ncbi:MAG: hypothetical protein NTZ24_16635 [Deltaproteobacteria bacterium]|nr:hypothetical protein [Deltaproteobacteria bacterium]